MTDYLSPNDQQAAQAEGWGLAPVYDTRDYIAAAVVPVGGRFSSPFEAKTFVWEQARRGSGVCRQALQIVASSEAARAPSTPLKKKRK